jgi:hypothetical protein
MKKIAIVLASLAVLATGVMASDCEVNLGKQLPHSDSID